MSFLTQKFYEIIFQLLFSIDMGNSSEEDLIPFVMGELFVTRKTVRAAYQKARMVFECREMLDQRIENISKEYALERIGRVERNVLRLFFYEIFYSQQEPKEKIIAEALRITRKFSTKEATAFVNALLDTENIDGQRPAFPLPEQDPS